MEPKSIARFGAYELNLRTGELRKSGVRVRLQEQPFQVLTALLVQPGELVTRESLQQRLWPDAVEGDFEQGLNKAVNKLRTALSDSADNPRFIETLARRGYRFAAPVVFDGPSPGQAILPLAPSGRAASEGLPLTAPTSPAKPFETKQIVPPPPALREIPEAPERILNSLSPPSAPSFPEASAAPPIPPIAPNAATGPALPALQSSGVPARPSPSLSALPWFALGVGTPIAFLAVFVVFGLILFFLWDRYAPSSRVPPNADGEAGIVERWSTAEGRFVPVHPAISGDGITFSPDHEWVAFVAFPSAQLFVMRRDGQALMAIAPNAFERTYLPEWSPDGQSIAFAARPHDGPWKVYIVHRDGSGLREANPGPGTEADPTWSPDGKILAFAPFPWETTKPGTGIFLLDMETSSVRQLEGSRGYFSPQWSPDGKYMAALTEGDSRLALYDFQSKAWKRITGVAAMHPAWDRRGTAVYYLAEGRVQRYIPATGVHESLMVVDGLPMRSNSPFGERNAPWIGLNPEGEVLILRAESPDSAGARWFPSLTRIASRRD